MEMGDENFLKYQNISKSFSVLHKRSERRGSVPVAGTALQNRQVLAAHLIRGQVA